jgi:hypothetical protein
MHVKRKRRTVIPNEEIGGVEGLETRYTLYWTREAMREARGSLVRRLFRDARSFSNGAML